MINLFKRVFALGLAGILLYYVTMLIVWIFGIFIPHYPINQLGAVGVLYLIDITFDILIKDKVH